MEKQPLSFAHFRDAALCLFDWYIVLSQLQDNWCKLPVANTRNTARVWEDVFGPRWQTATRYLALDRETQLAQD